LSSYAALPCPGNGIGKHGLMRKFDLRLQSI
jgi:hypothetical protein